MVKFGLFAAGAPALTGVVGSTALAQNLGPGNKGVGDIAGRDPLKLYTGHPVVGGGQMEIRLNQSIYTGDPHEIEVAQRLEPFNPESWYQEWRRVALINEEIAEGYAEQNLKVSAHEFYMRASRFHRLSIVYQEDSDETMMPGYNKLREMFDKAWQMRSPPFERVKVTVDGNVLDGFFRKPGGPPGTRFPTIVVYQGADSLAESTIKGNGSYAARGMASHVVDQPGQGAAKRNQHQYMPPDTERLV
jgi:hypothetical protein